MDSEKVIARRKRLREAARKIFEEFNIDGGVKKRAAKTKTLMPAVKPAGCKICGAPIEKTGKSGRPPTKCIKHR